MIYIKGIRGDKVLYGKKQQSYLTLHKRAIEKIWEMDSEEAKKYFEWYLSKIPERIEYLIKTCSEELQIPREYLDMSPESLKYIWKWFLQHIKIRKVSKISLIALRFRLINHNRDYARFKIKRAKEQMTLETEYMLLDISMYFGEMFVRNYTEIYWGYGRRSEVNSFSIITPILYGFKDELDGSLIMEPYYKIKMLALKFFDNAQKEDDLYNLYNEHLNYIPN